MPEMKHIIALAALACALALPAAAQSPSQSIQTGPGARTITMPPNAYPTTIAASGVWNSGCLSIVGYRNYKAFVTSTQAGVLSVLRFGDTACAYPDAAATLTQTIIASTPATVVGNDGNPTFGIEVTISNTSGSPATITKPLIILSGS